METAVIRLNETIIHMKNYFIVSVVDIAVISCCMRCHAGNNENRNLTKILQQ